ncbi:MAG: zinc-dependent alcohol dehydrogenase family protein [Acidobacteriota bacterium]
MRAMVLHSPGQPLSERDLPMPVPEAHQLLVRVKACAVCRTDLHVFDGELPHPKLPLVLGHEIVGIVVGKGSAVDCFAPDERVGIPWLGWTCGACHYCGTGRENLCDRALFTGYTLDGGYAEYTLADARYCFHIPESYADAEAAPLLCAGLIGYRSLLKTGDAERLGIYGFGAAAHLVAQVAVYQGRKLYVFTRPGDAQKQEFARQLGAVWAGDSDQSPPEALDAAIIFATPGTLIPLALRALAKGGIIVCGGIHMSDIPSFPYSLLWGERTVTSVANLTRRDGEAFLTLAPRVPIRTEIQVYPLVKANQALMDLKKGAVQGAAVLLPGVSYIGAHK